MSASLNSWPEHVIREKVRDLRYRVLVVLHLLLLYLCGDDGLVVLGAFKKVANEQQRRGNENFTLKTLDESANSPTQNKMANEGWPLFKLKVRVLCRVKLGFPAPLRRLMTTAQQLTEIGNELFNAAQYENAIGITKRYLFFQIELLPIIEIFQIIK